MANRRMFSLDVVNTDIFLDMPTSTQCLYFQLGMRADDDGFVSSPKRITNLVGCNTDDLKLLVAKGFIIQFDSGIIVITHWKVNNYLRADRYHPTLHQTEKESLADNENGYSVPIVGIPVVDKMETKERTEIGKSSIDYQLVADMYNVICISFSKLTKLSDKRKKTIKARFNQGYTVENFKRLFELAEASSFLKGGNGRNWQATFDWMIADANMAKILDGNYADRKKEGGSAEDETRSGSSFKL